MVYSGTRLRQAARLLTDDIELVAPDLIAIEVASAITRHFRMGGINTEEARSACESWLRHLQESVVVTVPSKDLLADAILVSLAIGHTLQDCLYVALAQREQAPLITNDRKLQERAARVGIAVNEPGHWEIN